MIKGLRISAAEIKQREKENAEFAKALREGLITPNEAREKAGLEPFKEFQKVAHEFGNPFKSPEPSFVQLPIACKNCGANKYQVGGLISYCEGSNAYKIEKRYYTCMYCGTTYEYKGAE